MRSDYALYAVAIICFIVAIYTTTINLETSLYIYAIAVLGIVFVGLGYIARPKKTTLSPITTTTLAPPPPEPLAETTETPTKQATKTTNKKRARKKKTTRSRKKKT
jgi:hypothetical protein